MTVKTEIEFLVVQQPRDRNGDPQGASDFLFRVGPMEVTVKIYNSALMMGNGTTLPLDKQKIVAQAFLENEVEQWGAEHLPSTVVMNENEMDIVFGRLGWPPRF